MNADERANLSAAAMWADDNASKWFGMELENISEGRAVMALTVTKNHCNGHKICHGGVTFALADSAFAFACNSYNQITLAQQNQITYVSPGHVDERLVAEAVEVSRTGRSGTYDVTVRGADGRIVALMRGLSRTVKGQTFPEESQI